MSKAKKLFVQYFRVLILIAIVSILAVIKPDAFWTWSNISTVLFQQAPYTMLMSFGMTLAILTSGIDKSMGSVLVLSSVAAAFLFKANHYAIGMIAALVIGCSCGIINGLLITKAKLPAFVATYGVDFFTLGFAYVITGGTSIYGFSDGFRSIANFNVGGVSSLAIITIAIMLLLQWVLTRTTFGRSMFLTGSNYTSARLSGINADLIVTATFAISGILAAVTGLLYMARLNAADPGISGSFILDSIAATLIGGNALGGGDGSILKSALGAVIIVFIRNGLNIIGVDSTWHQAVIGFVILGAILLEGLTRRMVKAEKA